MSSATGCATRSIQGGADERRGHAGGDAALGTLRGELSASAGGAHPRGRATSRSSVRARRVSRGRRRVRRGQDPGYSWPPWAFWRRTPRTRRQRALRRRGNSGAGAATDLNRVRGSRLDHGFPGSDDVPDAAPEDRRAAGRGPGAPPRRVLAGAERAALRALERVRMPRSAAASASNTRTSSPAACASA